MAEVRLAGIGKRFGARRVLEGIGLEIRSGELIGVLGPSGCGKSTLLRMIAGLERIGEGDLFIDGRRMNEVPPARRGIAMVFQSYALYPHMTARQNLAFALQAAGRPAAEVAAAVARVAGMLDLTCCLDRRPAALSGGQRQRVAIGRAILRAPRLFLFDEPFSNLDAGLRAAMRVELARLKQAMPASTMIHVTHDQTEAMTLADRIVVLAEGGIAQVGTPLDLYERPQTAFVARFIGSPAMNLLPGVVVATGARTRIRLDHGGAAVVAVATGDAALGLRVELGVRPEHLRPVGGPALFSGEVEVAETPGEATVLHFRRQGALSVAAKLPGLHPGLRGRALHLDADPQRLHLFHEGRALR